MYTELEHEHEHGPMMRYACNFDPGGRCGHQGPPSAHGLGAWKLLPLSVGKESGNGFKRRRGAVGSHYQVKVRGGTQPAHAYIAETRLGTS